jgi:hypothetical protein
MKTAECTPDPCHLRFLPNASFADAYCRDTEDTDCAIETIARRILSDRPVWVGALMTIRNIAVAPFALQTPAEMQNTNDVIGLFPILHRYEDSIVMGFDDSHLDFRVIIDSQTQIGGRRRITLTTLVQTKNRLGRMYLWAVMPFHHLIARSLLANAEFG